jgi:hypothetical protein
MKWLRAFILVCLAVGVAMAWTGLEADGQRLILKAPDGHCGEVKLSDLNLLSVEVVECP